MSRRVALLNNPLEADNPLEAVVAAPARPAPVAPATPTTPRAEVVPTHAAEPDEPVLSAPVFKASDAEGEPRAAIAPREGRKRKPSPSEATAVSASRVHRVGTRLDPYPRQDGQLVRPVRHTLPVKLIEHFQVIALRQGRTPTALVQELIEQYVETHRKLL